MSKERWRKETLESGTRYNHPYWGLHDPSDPATDPVIQAKVLNAAAKEWWSAENGEAGEGLFTASASAALLAKMIEEGFVLKVDD